MKKLFVSAVEFVMCLIVSNALILLSGLGLWAVLQILRTIASMLYTMFDTILTSVSLDNAFFACAFVIGTIFGIYSYCTSGGN